MKKYDYILLFIILLVGSVLRFHNLGDISFSNDELSALTRARFDSFHELIEKGIKVDGHPALVQTMMWFTIHHFNDDVFTVRFPFAVSGIVSVFFIFLLAKKWFGRVTALLSAAALATLQFPILYSQTARPYTIGLMFILALAYFWTRLLFDEKRSRWISAAYIFSLAACMYTHYFSFMLAGIIGVSGLFFLKKNNFVHYIFCNTLAVLLFLPSASIFQQQFGYGGIGGWLPAPDKTFLPRFLFYGFNESWFITVLLSITFIFSAILFFRKSGWKKFHSFSLIWYIIPFLVGYSYSIWKAPVLQFSTLIFSFPFLIIFCFSFLNEQWIDKKICVLLTFIILSAGVYSTVIEKKYYQTNHFGVFKELAEKTKEWDEKYGAENIIKQFSLSNPEYINYYFRKLNHDAHILIYSDDEQSKYGLLTNILDTTRANYFAYAWTNASHAYETPVLIQEKFPVVVENDTFFNSQITLFGRGTSSGSEKIITEADFEKNNWQNETEKQNKDVAHSGMYSQKMDQSTEYSISYETESGKLNLNFSQMLKAESWFYSSDSLRDASLVIAFLKKGQLLSYSGMPLRNFYSAKNKWTRAFLFSPVPENDCEIRVYIWNPKHETFYIDDLKVSTASKNQLFRQ